jgi:hypothetical protein
MDNQESESPKSGRGFHITIGTYPTGGLSLEQELQLVKAALVYADRVKLYSLTASLLFMMLRQREFTPDQQLKLLEIVVPYLASEQDARGVQASLAEYKHGFPDRSRHQRRALQKQFPRLLAQQWKTVEKTAIELAKQAKADSIERAVQAGLLELHTFEGTDRDEVVLEFIGDCIASAAKSPLLESRLLEMRERDRRILTEFVEGVCGAVSDGSTYPLFDTQTSELVRASIQADRTAVSEPDVERGKHSGLAGNLLERLPLFDQAPIDEILDIRRELARPLVRFRAAIVQFSESIKSASWDEDFPKEAEKVFHRDVGPAVLDIEEEVKSNKLLASVLRKFVDKPIVLPAGSIFTLAISKLSSLPNEIALSLGIGISSAAIVYDAYREWRQKERVIERNHLFFYYKARKRLSR